MTPVAGTAAPRKAPAALPPRRVSGPVRARVAVPATPRPRPRRGPQPLPRSLAQQVLARFRALPDHSLVDRLVRGRAWIPVLGVMLAGIVAMQVEVLKLGSSMGRSIERGSSLSSLNQELRASVAALGDDQRIERLAAAMGMVMPAPTSLKFLAVRPGATGTVAVHQPDATQFLASLPAPSTQAPTVSAPTVVAAATSAAATPSSGQTASAPTTSTAQTASAATATSSATAAPAAGTAPTAAPVSTQQQSTTTSSTATGTSTTGGASPAGPGG